MAHRQYYLTFSKFLFQTLYFIFSFLYFYALLWGWHSGTRVGAATAVRGLIGQILRTNGETNTELNLKITNQYEI